MGWMTTPDGRDGWATIFLRNGHSAYLVDQPGRGEAGAQESMSTDGFLDVWSEDSKEYRPGDQAWYTHFRIGRVSAGTLRRLAIPRGRRSTGSILPPDDPQYRQF